MSLKEKIGSVGFTILGFGFLGLTLYAALALIKGMLWFSETIYPYLLVIGSVIFWGGIIILLPLAFFKKTRGVSAIGFIVSSFFYGIILWFTSLITVYSFWGKVGVFVGFFFAFIGIIPEAFIAAIIEGAWSELGNLFLWLMIIIVHGILGAWLYSKHEQESL